MVAEAERNEGGLSDSEQQVLDMLRAGKVDAEIAVRLGVSNAEVKQRIERLGWKLRAKGRAELRDGAGFDPEAFGQSGKRIELTGTDGARWKIATALLAMTVLALGAFIVAARGGSSKGLSAEASATPTESDRTVTQVPPPAPTVQSIVLDGGVMLDAGQLFKGGSQLVIGSSGVVPAEVEVRESLLVVQLERAAVMQLGARPGNWSIFGGGPQLLSLAGNIGNVTYLFTMQAEQNTHFIFGDDDSVAVYADDSRRPEIAIWALSQTCGCYYHVNLREDGHLYVSADLMAESQPIAHDTGELLDISGMSSFGRAGHRDHRTYCADYEDGGCRAILRGGFRPSADSVVECNESSARLRVTSAGVVLEMRSTTGSSFTCGNDAGPERSIPAGTEVGYVGENFELTAQSADGTPLSVVVTPAGAIWVGHLSPKFSCPCRRGS